MITNAEVAAAKAFLDQAAALAERDQPVPEILIRHMLESAAAARSPQTVYCVVCEDEDAMGCSVHIFSTPEKAKAFADADQRAHVLYDYVIDHPERMEQPAQ